MTRLTNYKEAEGKTIDRIEIQEDSVPESITIYFTDLTCLHIESSEWLSVPRRLDKTQTSNLFDHEDTALY